MNGDISQLLPLLGYMAFMIGIYVGKPEDKETLGDFFPE